MTRPIQKVLVLVVGVVLMLAAGCQEAEAPSEKKTRFIAAENIELKKELAQRDEKITGLETKHAAQIDQAEKKLAKCQKQTAACKEELKKGMEEKVEGVLAAVMEQAMKLRMENMSLKAQIAELKGDPNEPAIPKLPE